jgi:antitoxin component YwqK of YwqJK toxin-antitoxin module
MTKNQHNEQGKGHGYWELYYSNRRVAYKGYLDNGNRIGLWKYYDYNGVLIMQIFYS